MTEKRKIEVFSAGCALCEDTIAMVRKISCDSCEVTIHNMNEPAAAQKAKEYGVRSVPAVVINGRLADCCSGRGPSEQVLRLEGIGISLT